MFVWYSLHGILQVPSPCSSPGTPSRSSFITHLPTFPIASLCTNRSTSLITTKADVQPRYHRHLHGLRFIITLHQDLRQKNSHHPLYRLQNDRQPRIA